MKIYRTNGDGRFDIDVQELQESEKIKVRVTHVMPTASDVNIFGGDSSTTYPFVIGHSAIGVVSDDRPEFGLKRGEKIIINPYGTKIVKSDEEDVMTAGVDIDGYMREFAYVEREEITVFPDDVTEKEAIFAEKIAVALKALNSFSLDKGQYVVIVGGDATCNILAQLAMYFQLIPILVDSNAANLALAEKCGIYYTVNATKESAAAKIAEITCGKMAEMSVLYMDTERAPSLTFSMTKQGGKCVIICGNKILKAFDADVSAISRRRLQVCGVNNGAAEFKSAVNILAQKILKLDGFIDKTVEIKDAEVLLREMLANRERYYSAVIKL